MRNLDAIINQLANEQLRTEHLLLEELDKIKKDAQAFFDSQSRALKLFYELQQTESDKYLAFITTQFDDVKNRIQNGYPKERGFGELTEDPVPEFLTRGRKVTDEEREKIVAGLEENITQDKK